MLINFGVTTQHQLNRLKVAYNDAYRILHGMPRYQSGRESQLYYNYGSFYALQRKITYKFIERCHLSTNLWLKTLMSSDCFYDSIYSTMIIIVAFCM